MVTRGFKATHDWRFSVLSGLLFGHYLSYFLLVTSIAMGIMWVYQHLWRWQNVLKSPP
jgi:hypothetical protein